LTPGSALGITKNNLNKACFYIQAILLNRQNKQKLLQSDELDYLVGFTKCKGLQCSIMVCL